jgi:hypothetical protein
VIAALLLVATLAGDDVASLDVKLRSRDERERRAAVQELAKLDSHDGWTRVIDALGDASPMVADEAEIQLAKLKGVDLIEDLCGKRGLLAKDPWVAIHAAGALGSVETGPVSGASLAHALQTKSNEARRILCASVEKLANAKRISSPDKLDHLVLSDSNAEDPELAAAALLAFMSLPQLDHLSIADCVHEHDRPPRTCAILRLASDATDDKTRKFVASCAQHADRSVRAQVVENLVSRPNAEALAMLVAMLEKETNKRLFDTIDSALEKLSGLSGGGKPSFWRAWVDHLGPEWKPATRDAKPRESQGDTTAPKLVGQPIVSSQLAILVDFSGSIWEKREDGKTRKQKLDEEMKKSLEALAPDTLFNVIPYTNEPIPWEKALVTATPANVKRALEFFTKCKASGKGNFWDAAMLALEDPKVDTILVLTDGAPTGGHRWNVELMHERYVERNRFRHVALDAVIVDAKKGMQERWRKFCEDTGGRMLAVELK